MIPMRREVLYALVLSAALCAGCREETRSPLAAPTRQVSRTAPASPVPPESVSAALRSLFAAEAAPAFVATDGEPGAGRWASVRDFYEERRHEPVWGAGEGSLARIVTLVDALCHADSLGLYPADYNLPSLQAAFDRAYSDDGRSPESLALLDALLTYSFLEYGSIVLNGWLDPAETDAAWHIETKEANPDTLLRRGLREGRLREVLAGLEPGHDGYRRLKAALARYKEIAARGGWPAVPGDSLLRPGDRNPRVALLKQRLIASGDLDPSAGSDSTFDGLLLEAVARFQERHGLAVDTVVGRGTLKWLNLSVQDRIRQIEINLERWRWLPSTLGQRFILVNLPSFELYAYEGGRRVLSMPVVIGDEYNDQATPVFSDRMTHIIFRPYWNVPPSISMEEIAPKARRDPSYLRRNHYEIVRSYGTGADPLPATAANLQRLAEGSLRVRQTPGSWNSLGLVKFMFPNAFNIYLHDTPAKSLFQQRVRAASHGCIRVGEPGQLAQFALGDSAWTRYRIEEAMQQGANQQINLEEPIPVYILYLTAWVDEEGRERFREDLYERDLGLIEAFNRRAAGAAGADPHRICRMIYEKLGVGSREPGIDDSSTDSRIPAPES